MQNVFIRINGNGGRANLFLDGDTGDVGTTADMNDRRSEFVTASTQFFGVAERAERRTAQSRLLSRAAPAVAGVGIFHTHSYSCGAAQADISLIWMKECSREDSCLVLTGAAAAAVSVGQTLREVKEHHTASYPLV